MSLGKRIQYYRKKFNFTQEELAEKLLVSRQAVSRWESDNNEPDIKTLIALSDIFEISVDQLIREEKENEEIKGEEKLNLEEDIIIQNQEAILKTHRKNYKLLVFITSIILLLLMVFVVCPLMIALSDESHQPDYVEQRSDNLDKQIKESSLVSYFYIAAEHLNYKQQKFNLTGNIYLNIESEYRERKELIVIYEDQSSETILLRNDDYQFIFNQEITAKNIDKIEVIVGEEKEIFENIQFPIEDYMYKTSIGTNVLIGSGNQSFSIDIACSRERTYDSFENVANIADDGLEEAWLPQCQIDVYKDDEHILSEEFTHDFQNKSISILEKYDENAKYKVVYSYITPLGQKRSCEKII